MRREAGRVERGAPQVDRHGAPREDRVVIVKSSIRRGCRVLAAPNIAGFVALAFSALACSSSPDPINVRVTGPYEAPQVLATGLSYPRSLVHEADRLFFVAGEESCTSSCAVFGLSDQGGAPQLLQPTKSRLLAHADQTLYWLGADGIYAMPTSGGDPALVVSVLANGSSAVQEMVADSTGIYWTVQDSEGYGAVWAFTFGATEPAAITPVQSAPDQLAVDGDSVYWTASGALYRAPKSGGDATQLAVFDAGSDGVALDDANVYWSSLDNAGTVRSVRKDGGDTEILSKGIDHPREVAVDDVHVYYTAEGAGSLMRLRKSGGSLERLAVEQALPHALALSADRVFWANLGDGVISSVSK